MFDVNFAPKNMTVQELREGMYWLAESLYSDESLRRRRRPFFEELWRRHELGGEELEAVAPSLLPIVS